MSHGPRRLAPRILACLLAAVAAGTAAAERHVNFVVGAKRLESNDWRPIDAQQELGLQLTLGDADARLGLAIDLWLAHDRGTAVVEVPDVGPADAEHEGRTAEVGIGARMVWRRGHARPFLGGGLAVLGARIETAVGGERSTDSGQDLGVWVGGGCFWRVGAHLNLGIAVHVSRGDVELLGAKVDAGGEHVAAIVGYGW